MSLNFVETLLDKLTFPFLSGKEILPRKFSGSQNLMDTNSRMSSNILSEFHQLLDSAYLAPNDSSMNLSTGVKNNFQYFESGNNSLVSHVPKLLSPSFSILQGLHVLSSHSELLFGSDFVLNRRGSILNETLDQLDLFKMTGFGMKSPQPTSKMPGDPVNLSHVIDVCAKPAATVAQESTAVAPDDDISVLKSQKYITDSCHTLNQELINRKEKELNKRSKKRRRRQKKNNAVNSEKSAENSKKCVENSKKCVANSKKCVENSKKTLKQKESVVTPSRIPIPESLSLNCDILCDIVSVTGQASAVQIVLPELTSFVISVESGDEDDADWDACSDSEWLTDCAEFELSGLFVANLTAPKISECPKKRVVSQLDVPPISDDKEAHKLHNPLLHVNKTWNETNKEIESTPKVPSKVCFAPEDQLVQVLFVEEYDRKGEWETFALGRMRFKKRIDELESVLSPCLSEEHREKVFHRINQTHL